MDLDTLRAMQEPAGRYLLEQAVALAPDDATFLACTGKLGKRQPPALVRAALQTAMWRLRASAKFRLADRMWFTREALEQATSETVATHRARRFTGTVLDIGCGIGGDALALAVACRVVGVDRDPVRLEMARLNLRAHGLEDRCEFLLGDALSMELPRCDAVFVDPDRRVGGKRRLSVSEGEPSLESVRKRFPGVPLCAKLAPGVPLDEVDEGEAEFVSLDGELKECALWLGWGTHGRRVTALPSGEGFLVEKPARLPEEQPPGAWLIDPGPATARAGLVGDLARRLGAWPLDAGTAFLSADDFVPTPLARGWRIHAAMTLHAGRLRERLRGVGRVDVIRRGVPVDPEELVRKLKLEGDGAATLALCPVAGVPHALVCDALPAR